MSPTCGETNHRPAPGERDGELEVPPTASTGLRAAGRQFELERRPCRGRGGSDGGGLPRRGTTGSSAGAHIGRPWQEGVPAHGGEPLLRSRESVSTGSPLTLPRGRDDRPPKAASQQVVQRA